MNRIAFGIHNMFSMTARERCMSNLKKLAVPQFGKPPESSAAVLVPLCRVDNVPSLLYVVRAPPAPAAPPDAPAPAHGEVTFPGGMLQRQENPVQTALRETEAAIGLAAARVDVWCCGPAVPGRDYRTVIVPVIGSIDNIAASDLNIKQKEVLEVFTVPVELLCDPRNQYHTQFVNGYVLPVFMAEQYKIWGMTAFITHAFLNSTLSKDIYKHDWMNKKVVVGRRRNK